MPEILSLNNFHLTKNGVRLAYGVNYNPLNLPDNTIRLKYKQGTTPTFSKGTGVLVDADENIWDLTYNSISNSWTQLLMNHTDLIDVLGANSKNIKSMNSMFIYCESLSSINLFDTREVTNMDNIFSYCYNLSSIPNFDINAVTSINGMFRYCYSLTSIPLLNTQNVSSMVNTFADCSSLNTIPLLNTTKVKNMGGAFYHCYNLNHIPLIDTQNVTNMDVTFAGCSSLTSIPLFDTHNVSSFNGTFGRNSISSSPLLDTSNAVSVSRMFSNCQLTSVPLFDTHNVVDMKYFLSYNENLKYIPLFNTEKVENINWGFINCYNVTGGALDLYNQLSTQTNPPTAHTDTFIRCGRDTQTGSAELAQIPSAWGGTGA